MDPQPLASVAAPVPGMSSVDSIPVPKGPRRKRGGRPVVSDDVRRDARVSAACTQEQADEIHASARARGLTASEFLLASVTKTRMPRALAVGHEALHIFTQLGPVIDLLRADSRNLNQLARAANEQRLLGHAVVVNDDYVGTSLESHAARLQTLVSVMVDVRRLLNPSG